MPTDTELIDFLADRSQNIANVLLPRDIVEANFMSLREAIAAAMERHREGNP